MLSDNIRKLRVARGISQVDLANALGVSKQSVSNWENGNILPSIEVLCKLSRYFSVRTDFLLDMDDRMYLEMTGLTLGEIEHLKLIIRDLLNR